VDTPAFYLWFDTEYTSLDLDTARIMQAALMITDTALKRVGPGIDLVVSLPPDEFVQSWIEKNASELLQRCRQGGLGVEEVDARLSRHVDEQIGPPAREVSRRPVLAGNSVHADWLLMRRFLPLLAQRINYRLLDVTALKLQWQQRRGNRETKEVVNKDDPEFLRRYFPEAELLSGRGQHDAYYDIQASAAELAFYRAHLFRS